MARNISTGRPWRLGEFIAFSAFALSVWAALINLLYSEFRGTGELFVVGSYHCDIIDISVFFGVIAFIFVPKERLLVAGPNGRMALSPLIAKLSISILILIDLANWSRGLYLDAFKASFAQRSDLFLILTGGFLIWMQTNDRILRILTPLLLFGSFGLICIYISRVIYGSNYGVDTHTTEYIEFLYGDKRLLTADAATFLACAGVYFLDKSIEDVRKFRNVMIGLVAIGTLAIGIVTRQRTATIALVLSVIMYFAAAPRLIGRLPWLVRISAILLFFGAIIAFFVLGPDRVLDLMPDTFKTAATKTATLDVRHRVWAAGLDRFSTWGVLTHLIGVEAGRPYLIFIDGEEWKAQMHNVYVGTLMQSGIVGLGVFGVFVINGLFNVLAALSRRWVTNDAGVSPQVGLAWLTIMLVYGYSYEWHNMLCVFALAPMAAWSELGRSATKTVNRRPAPGQRPRPRARVRAPRAPSPDIGALGGVDA